jgi:short-subunit dehydrogenase
MTSPRSSPPRHVAITGASSGIGEALARAFARRGDRLTLVARRRELLERLNVECGGGAHLAVHDLSDPARALDWIAAAETRHGPIDVLINNAGIDPIGLAVSSDVAEGRKVLDLNMVTPILITRALLPAMVERRSGVLVQVASVAAIVAPAGQAWYSASKAGLAQFAETLRYDLEGTGVHSMVVYPGPVKTPMGDSAFATYGGREGPAGRAPEGTSEELAQWVLAAVDRRRARVIYPAFYWLSWLFPWFARWVVSMQRILPRGAAT